MDYTKLFYLLTVADNAKALFTTIIIIFTIVSAVSTITYFISSHTERAGGQTDDDKENQAMARKWMWWCYPITILFWSLQIAIPSKRDALLIVAGGQTLNFLSTDESSKKIPEKLSSFILLEIENMAEEAKVDLNISKKKKDITESVKSLTTEELIKQLKDNPELYELLIKDK
jgi:hypothetical protein